MSNKENSLNNGFSFKTELAIPCYIITNLFNHRIPYCNFKQALVLLLSRGIANEVIKVNTNCVVFLKY